MPATEITSAAQMQQVIASTMLVVIVFHQGGGRSVQMFDMYAGQVASTGAVTFAKCDISTYPELAQQYNVTVNPTFVTFKNGALDRRIEGEHALGKNLDAMLAEEPSSSSASDNSWCGAPVAKGWSNITHNVEVLGLDIMNANTEFGGPRVLFDASAPSALEKGKEKVSSSEEAGGKDWVESDTDEQLMLFIPFQGASKIHSLHITSLAPTDEDEDDDEIPSRPKTIKLFSNTAQILGFEDAESRAVTQTIELKPEDWDAKTGTAVVNTRFVKFQNVSAVTVFFVDVERDGAEKVRIDRVRIIGGALHEKVDMHKLKGDQNNE